MKFIEGGEMHLGFFWAVSSFFPQKQKQMFCFHMMRADGMVSLINWQPISSLLSLAAPPPP